MSCYCSCSEQMKLTFSRFVRISIAFQPETALFFWTIFRIMLRADHKDLQRQFIIIFRNLAHNPQKDDFWGGNAAVWIFALVLTVSGVKSLRSSKINCRIVTYESYSSLKLLFDYSLFDSPSRREIFNKPLNSQWVKDIIKHSPL